MSRLRAFLQKGVQWAGTRVHDALLLCVSIPVFIFSMAIHGILGGFRAGRSDALELWKSFWKKEPPA